MIPDDEIAEMPWTRDRMTLADLSNGLRPARRRGATSILRPARFASGTLSTWTPTASRRPGAKSHTNK